MYISQLDEYYAQEQTQSHCQNKHTKDTQEEKNKPNECSMYRSKYRKYYKNNHIEQEVQQRNTNRTKNYNLSWKLNLQNDTRLTHQRSKTHHHRLTKHIHDDDTQQQTHLVALIKLKDI